jgi:uncharacterized protein YecE (DUF72 family)
MDWRIGTMGFSYPDWVGPFYPIKSKASDFLQAYARAFDTVELDTTFHAAPSPERVARWAEQVPEHFRFCPKAPRAITHDQSLTTAGGAFRDFLRAVRHFGPKLGPVVLQFPPSFTAREFGKLRIFLRELPEDIRFALEFRHPTWENEQTFDLLQKARCAWVAGDYGVDPFPVHPTTDFLYVRFIGIHQQFDTHARERIDMHDRLAWWKQQLDVHDRMTVATYALFNNDFAGHAPATANRLKALVGQPATTATREMQTTLF